MSVRPAPTASRTTARVAGLAAAAALTLASFGGIPASATPGKATPTSSKPAACAQQQKQLDKAVAKRATKRADKVAQARRVEKAQRRLDRCRDAHEATS